MLVAYVGVTWSLQALVPVGEIGAVQGIVQAVDLGLRRVGLESWLAPLAVVMAVSTGGALAAWYVGATRVPFVAGFEHALPSALGRVHPRWGSPHVALLVQAGLSPRCIVVVLAGSTVAEAYQIFLQVVGGHVARAVLLHVPRAGAAGRGAVVAARGGRCRVLRRRRRRAGGVRAAGRRPSTSCVFELKLVAGALGPMALGLWLYWRAQRARLGEEAASLA